MSGQDVYGGEMSPRVLTDQHIELLLGGNTPPEDALARFRRVLASLHEPLPSPPGDDRVRLLAARAAEISLQSREGRFTGQTNRRPSTARSIVLRRRLAGGLAAAVLMSGLTGVAAAADGAGPGDALYGLDRALEVIGIGDGGVEERLAEARNLVEGGHTPTAIEHVADAVDARSSRESSFSPEAAKASEALRGAAESVRSAGAGRESADMRSAVATMLSEIAAILEAEELDDAALGEKISEIARALSGKGNTDTAGEPQDGGPDSTGSGNPGQGRGPSGASGGGPSSTGAGGPPEGKPESSPNRP